MQMSLNYTDTSQLPNQKKVKNRKGWRESVRRLNLPLS